MKESIMKNAGIESLFSDKMNLEEDAPSYKGM